MSATDAMIRRLEQELDERNQFMQGLTADAEAGDGRDLTTGEMEMLNRASGRVDELEKQLEPLRKAAIIANESRARIQEVDQQITNSRRREVGLPEYRSAGVYIADLYQARMGDRESMERLEVFHRAAAHQTTADNAGLLPERIVEPVVNGVDESRPLVAAIGPQDLGAGSWAYARVTQHTQVGLQAAEKAELPSRKMIVAKTPITAPTLGGYVNVSKQDIRRTSPQILDMVISDLTGQYAIESEDAAGAVLVAAATAGTTEIPATPTALGISTAVWGAAGQAAGLLRTANIPAQGPILAVSADRLGLIGPLFPTVNPRDAFSTGFGADSVQIQGPQGQIANLTVVLAAGLPAATVLFLYRSAVRCYEDRYGAMQVNEPSVWGVQVGYAGDFETVVFDAGGIISITQAA